jgi:hypothetical protein
MHDTVKTAMDPFLAMAMNLAWPIFLIWLVLKVERLAFWWLAAWRAKQSGQPIEEVPMEESRASDRIWLWALGGLFVLWLIYFWVVPLLRH